MRKQKNEVHKWKTPCSTKSSYVVWYGGPRTAYNIPFPFPLKIKLQKCQTKDPTNYEDQQWIISESIVLLTPLSKQTTIKALSHWAWLHGLQDTIGFN